MNVIPLCAHLAVGICKALHNCNLVVTKAQCKVEMEETPCLRTEIKLGGMSLCSLKVRNACVSLLLYITSSPDIKQILKSFVADGSEKFTGCGRETCVTTQRGAQLCVWGCEANSEMQIAS
jgi:hypothetical protein